MKQIRISFLITERIHEEIMQAAESKHLKRNKYIIDVLSFVSWNDFQHLNKGLSMQKMKMKYKQYKNNQK